MRKKILLKKYDRLRQAFDDDPYTCEFFFSIVDSSLVGLPEQKSATTYHEVTVTITWEMLVNWGLDPNNNPDKDKLLSWYAEERIKESVKSGSPPAKDELTIEAQTTKDRRHPAISLIPDPRGHIFYVDVDVDKIHSHNEVSIDDIESFAQAHDIDPQEVKPLLPLNLAEDQIQIFFEEIIGENFHQDDWGGEMNDLVTSHLRIGGRRLRAAFLLKGNGTRGKLTIAKCGRNGDQIVRLTEAPVDLYVIQHVDEIDQRVIYDLGGKVALKNERGEHCKLCIIDGTDTARILRAYGKI